MPFKNPPPCRYRTGKTLGQGTYAVVKEVFEIETGKRFAAKVLNKSLLKGREHLIRNEINVLSKISKGHKNIVSLVDYFETMHNLYLVMEMATGGELFDRIWEQGFFYEKEASTIMRTVIEAVQYLHDQGIVHRDLKVKLSISSLLFLAQPENLLYETKKKDSQLLVADFGLAKVMDPDQFYSLVTTCGTPGYMAPEIYLKTGYGKPVDLWAIGVITYFLLSGEPPFNEQDTIIRVRNITNAVYSFKSEKWEHVTDSAKDFISKLLVKDPATRMTAVEALNHPWVNPPSPRTLAAQDPLNKPISFDRNAEPGQDSIRPTDVLRRSLRNAFNVVSAVNQLIGLDKFPVDEEVGHA